MDYLKNKYPRFYPLIEVDDSGKDFEALFMTADKKNVQNERCKFYLEELVPSFYKLISNKKVSSNITSQFKIHCPMCKHEMTTFIKGTDDYIHQNMFCPICSGGK